MASQATSKPKKWALLIGINSYPALPDSPRLGGCVNDVALLAEILQRHYGFAEDQVVSLRDDEATRAAILSGLDDLLARVGPGDTVVVHYSGLGTRVLDPEAPAGSLPALVPADSVRGGGPGLDISTADLYERVLPLAERAANLAIILDTCHASTLTRDAFGASHRWLELDEHQRQRWETWRLTPEDRRRLYEEPGPSGWLPLSSRYVLIAACRADESSYELGGTLTEQGEPTLHGALTYFLGRELVRAERGATYRDIFEQASPSVTVAYPRQHPQLEGSGERDVFGTRAIHPLQFARVIARDGDQVTLDVGAAHGITVRSEWGIYPARAKRDADEQRKIGLVEITEVGATESRSRLLAEGGTDAVSPGAQAREEAHYHGEMRLKVQIQVPERFAAAEREIAALIAESELLQYVQPDDAAADVRAYVVDTRSVVQEGDPVPQLGAVRQPLWAVIGGDGRLLLPTAPLGTSWSALELRDSLERVARYRLVLQLTNPDPLSVLKGKVELVLLRQAVGEAEAPRWVEAQPEKAGGQTVFVEGERIAYRIANRSPVPIYVSVFDFGLDAAITLVHPLERETRSLEPGEVVEVGTSEAEYMELYIPENVLPREPAEPDSPDGGIETIKLFATSSETDFVGLLVQDGLRDGRLRAGSGTPLWGLLDLALTGSGARGLRRTRLPLEQEWTTVERSITLRRRSR